MKFVVSKCNNICLTLVTDRKQRLKLSSVNLGSNVAQIIRCAILKRILLANYVIG